jgi:hypothetical protein
MHFKRSNLCGVERLEVGREKVIYVKVKTSVCEQSSKPGKTGIHVLINLKSTCTTMGHHW